MQSPAKATLLITAASLFCLTAHAQETEMNQRFMMLNQWQCPYEHVSDIIENAEQYTAPVLEGMMEDGEIEDWGILTHAWGDEWNVNFYMVTENHSAFVEAWNSFIRRTREAQPDSVAGLGTLCTVHRDNLYTLHDLD